MVYTAGMRKFSMLAATIGSTAAWYVLSNKKLRGELAKAKSPDDTVQILTRYLGRDCQNIGKAVHEWVRSEEVQETLTRAKEVKDQTFESAKRGFSGLLGKAKQAKDAATEAIKKKTA